MIKINNLHKSFKNTEVLNGFTCSFDTGIYGLLGPNGAGKTTLIRCIAGLYNFKGSIEFDNAESAGSRKKKCNIGYLPQKFGLFPNLKVIEMMQYFATEKNVHFDEIEKVLDFVGLKDKINQKTSALSGGMIRRLGIAQAILGSPSVILLDEPTVGLDPEERIKFKEIVSNLNDKIIILSTHIVTDVEDVCDNILVMRDGALIFNAEPDQLKNTAKGKIYIIPQEDKSLLKEEYIIQSELRNADKKLLKVISSQKQSFKAADPTLEDGYICCLKNI